MSTTVAGTALPTGNTQSDMMSIDELMAETQLSRAGAYRALRANNIPHIRIGRNIRIRRSTFRRWIEQNEAKAAA